MLGQARLRFEMLCTSIPANCRRSVAIKGKLTLTTFPQVTYRRFVQGCGSTHQETTPPPELGGFISLDMSGYSRLRCCALVYGAIVFTTTLDRSGTRLPTDAKCKPDQYATAAMANAVTGLWQTVKS
jgi:hypothetical protein